MHFAVYFLFSHLASNPGKIGEYLPLWWFLHRPHTVYIEGSLHNKCISHKYYSPKIYKEEMGFDDNHPSLGVISVTSYLTCIYPKYNAIYCYWIFIPGSYLTNQSNFTLWNYGEWFRYKLEVHFMQSVNALIPISLIIYHAMRMGVSASYPLTCRNSLRVWGTFWRCSWHWI